MRGDIVGRQSEPKIHDKVKEQNSVFGSSITMTLTKNGLRVEIVIAKALSWREGGREGEEREKKFF